MNSLFPSALWAFLDFQAADEVKGKERIGRALFKIYAIAVSPVRSTELCEPILHPCDVVPPTKIYFLVHQRIGEGRGGRGVRFSNTRRGQFQGHWKA